MGSFNICIEDRNTQKSFGSFFTGKPTTKKYEVLSTKDLKLFKAEKENTKGGFMSVRDNLSFKILILKSLSNPL